MANNFKLTITFVYWIIEVKKPPWHQNKHAFWTKVAAVFKVKSTSGQNVFDFVRVTVVEYVCQIQWKKTPENVHFGHLVYKIIFSCKKPIVEDRLMFFLGQEQTWVHACPCSLTYPPLKTTSPWKAARLCSKRCPFISININLRRLVTLRI